MGATKTELKEFIPADSLSGSQNIEVLVGRSPEEIKKQLVQIALPFSVLSVYAQNGRHYMWLKLTEKIRKKVKINK